MQKAIQIERWALAIALFAVASLPCFAADAAVLRNGFSIRHEHRRVVGTMTRLYVSKDDSSFVEVPTAEIDHFEAALEEAAQPVAGSHSESQASGQNIGQALDLNEVVKAASGTYDLNPDLVNSVIRAESGFNVRAVSPKGAQGLMQLMPKTASELGVHNAFDPEANVDAGARYLHELLVRYNFDLVKALAAYNAGPQRVEQYGGVPPYYETKAYVARIVRDFNKKILAEKAAAQSAAQTSSASKSTATHAAAVKPHKPVAPAPDKANLAQSDK